MRPPACGKRRDDGNLALRRARATNACSSTICASVQRAGPVELGDDRRGAEPSSSHLIDAILVAVEREQPAVAAKPTLASASSTRSGVSPAYGGRPVSKMSLIFDRNRVEAAPQVPGRDRAPRSPQIRDGEHRLAGQSFAVVEVHRDRALQADIVDGKHVGSQLVEDEEHFRRPTADAFDVDQRRDQRLVVELASSAAGRGVPTRNEPRGRSDTRPCAATGRRRAARESQPRPRRPAPGAESRPAARHRPARRKRRQIAVRSLDRNLLSDDGARQRRERVASPLQMHTGVRAYQPSQDRIAARQLARGVVPIAGLAHWRASRPRNENGRPLNRKNGGVIVGSKRTGNVTLRAFEFRAPMMGRGRTVLTLGFAALCFVALATAKSAYAAADPNKILHVAIEAGDDGFDPSSSTNYYSGLIEEVIFDRLLTYDYLAEPVKLVPMAAESLPEVTDGGKTFTFHLRKGLFFTPDPAFK